MKPVADIVRQYMDNLMPEAVLAWSEAGRPAEEFLPALRTALLQEGPFSRSRLLDGRIENLQPLLEYIGNGKNGPPPPLEDPQEVTTLEAACGLVAVQNHERLFAQVMAFGSKQTRDEINAVVISVVAREFLGLERRRERTLEELFRELDDMRFHDDTVMTVLSESLDERALRFFLLLSSQSMSEVNFCCYGNGPHLVVFMRIIEEWKRFCRRVL